ncbi:MAG: hypothetical protein M9918_01845 [Anaerolineae bacterium]|nr:hypothetical protein [Anaerolineae bacterium]
MKLSAENFTKARTYIFTQGRDLERTQFSYYFESGSADAVLDALADYQNSDGGFGNAIEPDIRCEPSTPIGTTVALQILRDLGVTSASSLVRGAISYCLQSYDTARARWDFNTPPMNSAPHAPWWTFDSDNPLPVGFDSNPSAQIVGHLWHYAELVPEPFLKTVTEQMMDCLQTLPETIQYNAMLCWLWTVSADNLPAAYRQAILDKLHAIIDHVVERDPENWSDYAAKPLDLAPFPDAPLAEVLADDIQVNLDYEIAHQGDDGAWAPNWSWFGDYDEVWPTAEREWKGALTVHMLRSLKAYNRL